MRWCRPLALISAALLAPAAWPHDGAHPDAIAPPEAGPDSVRRNPDGTLFVPKTMQRLLTLRTAPVTAVRETQVLAEVRAAPEAALTLAAPESGRLEAPAGGWPLPGQRVAAGQTLGWIVPAVSVPERARRAALKAELEQKLAIARLNAERQRVQAAVTPDGGVARGNIYLEQAEAEERGLTVQLAEAEAALTARRAMRALASGLLLSSEAVSGRVVPAGEPLFRLRGEGAARVAVQRFSPRPTPGAEASLDGALLALRGSQPVAQGGWEWLFDLPAHDGPTDALVPGALVTLTLREPRPGALPEGSCQRMSEGRGLVWLHGAAEEFIPVLLPDCGKAFRGRDDARIVVHGGSLLSAYFVRLGGEYAAP